MEQKSTAGQGGGLTLLQLSAGSAATLGEVVTFSCYILNEGSRALLDVRLVPVSLSNAEMAPLRYLNTVPEVEPVTATLLPGAFVKWTFQYQIGLPDVAAKGPIISAMAATAMTDDGTLLRVESDVLIAVAPAS